MIVSPHMPHVHSVNSRLLKTLLDNAALRDHNSFMYDKVKRSMRGRAIIEYMLAKTKVSLSLPIDKEVPVTEETLVLRGLEALAIIANRDKTKTNWHSFTGGDPIDMWEWSLPPEMA